MKIKRFSAITILCNFLMLLIAQSGPSQIVKAVDDTVYLVPEIPVTINLLANDTFPISDSIRILPLTIPHIQIKITYSNLGFFTFQEEPYWGFHDTIQGSYTLVDYTLQKTSSAKILFRCHDHSYDSLDINNVSATFNAAGSHFWLPGTDFQDYNLTGIGPPAFIVPKGTGNNRIRCNSLWIGGKDDDSTLYFAGECYPVGIHMYPDVEPAPDYYAGPVMDSVNYSVSQDTTWNRLWKVTKLDIEYHKSHWNDPGYIPIPTILTWPGNGKQGSGQAEKLAPFYDRNNDGIYDPSDGDYPLIRGDQALYFIFND